MNDKYCGRQDGAGSRTLRDLGWGKVHRKVKVDLPDPHRGVGSSFTPTGLLSRKTETKFPDSGLKHNTNRSAGMRHRKGMGEGPSLKTGCCSEGLHFAT